MQWTSLLSKQSNSSDPCLAFRRRPLLRNYVRAVEFNPGASDEKFIRPERMLVIAHEFELLPTLEVVKWWKVDNRFTHTNVNSVQLIVQAMAKIRNLREITLPLIYYVSISLLDTINQQLSTVSIMPQDSFPAWAQWLARHRHGLRELNVTTSFAFECDSMFENLQKFSLNPIADLSRFVIMMKMMPNLQELTVYFTVQDLDLWEAEYHEYAKLTKLKILRICLNPFMGSSLIYGKRPITNIIKCYKYIAMNSRRLENLCFFTTDPAVHRNLHGDKLLSEIINTHATSIHTLRLDDMTITKDALLRLFTRCTHLRELGVKMNSRALTLTIFSTLGPLTVTLRQLHLTLSVNREPEDLEIERFLSQGMPKLTSLIIYTIGDSKFGQGNAQCVIWEHRWVYNQLSDSPHRKIIKMPAFTVSWKNKI